MGSSFVPCMVLVVHSNDSLIVYVIISIPGMPELSMTQYHGIGGYDQLSSNICCQYHSPVKRILHSVMLLRQQHLQRVIRDGRVYRHH
jgi:hypothetical protein